MIAIFAVAAFALGASVVVGQWSEQSRRAREDELLRIGDAYAKAVASYRANSAGSERPYPPSLESLLEDKPFVSAVRHLRKLYADPVSGGKEWGLIRAPDGGVAGVYSQSEMTPRRQVPVALAHARLAAASRYSDWKFSPSDADKP